MSNQLGERESRALLTEGVMGRLGCSDNGKPYVVPVPAQTIKPGKNGVIKSG